MPNRKQGRHPELDERPQDAPEEEMRKPTAPQDALDPRAKNSGHGKKTADKWNQ